MNFGLKDHPLACCTEGLTGFTVESANVCSRARLSLYTKLSGSNIWRATTHGLGKLFRLFVVVKCCVPHKTL